MPPNIGWFIMLIMHYLMTTARYATINETIFFIWNDYFMSLIWNPTFQRKKNEQKHSQDAREKYLELEDLDSVHKVSFK